MGIQPRNRVHWISPSSHPAVGRAHCGGLRHSHKAARWLRASWRDLQQMQMPMHFLLVATILAAANAFVPSPTKQLARRRAQPRQSASSMKVCCAHRPPWHLCLSAPLRSGSPWFSRLVLFSGLALLAAPSGEVFRRHVRRGPSRLGYADRVQCRRHRCAARGQIRWGEDGLEQLARTAAGGREFGRGDQTDGRS